MNTRVLLLASLLALCSCASVPGTAPVGPPDEAIWQSRYTQLEKVGNWELQGRVGIVNGKDGGSGSMDWKQQGDVLAFSFRGPFGAGTLEVRGDSKALWVAVPEVMISLLPIQNRISPVACACPCRC